MKPLVDAIAARLKESERDELLLRLDERPDNVLLSHGSLEDPAWRVAEHFERRGRLEELQRTLAQMRPDVGMVQVKSKGMQLAPLPFGIALLMGLGWFAGSRLALREWTGPARTAARKAAGDRARVDAAAVAGADAGNRAPQDAGNGAGALAAVPPRAGSAVKRPAQTPVKALLKAPGRPVLRPAPKAKKPPPKGAPKKKKKLKK